MKKRAWQSVLMLCAFVAMPALAKEGTIANGLSNIIALINALVGVLWNAKMVVGLAIFVSGVVGYAKLSDPKQNQVQPSLILPITAMILGGVLAAKGGIDWGSDMLGITADDNEIIYKNDGRANVAAMAKYDFKKVPPSNSKD